LSNTSNTLTSLKRRTASVSTPSFCMPVPVDDECIGKFLVDNYRQALSLISGEADLRQRMAQKGILSGEVFSLLRVARARTSVPHRPHQRAHRGDAPDGILSALD
jgi:hypothetical protein